MPAGATYEPIATTTLASATNTITFSSIPATYTDIRLVFFCIPSAANDHIAINLNNDTAGNYSETYIVGDGTSAFSGRTSGAFKWRQYGGIVGTNPNLLTMDLFSYAGSTYKTALFTFSNDSNGSGRVHRQVSLWSSTSAVNRIDLTFGTYQFAIGSRATLYGIQAA